MRSLDSAPTVNDTALAAVLRTLDDPDFRVIDVTSIHEVIEAALSALGRVPAFNDIEVWAIEPSRVLIVVDAQPGIRLSSEPVPLAETFAAPGAVTGAGAVRHVLDGLLRLHHQLIDDLGAQYPDIPPRPDPAAVARVLDDRFDVETADYLGEDTAGRTHHIMHDLRALARWYDIATSPVRYGLPGHLRGTLRAGHSAADVERACSELGDCSRLRLICLWDHHDPVTGYRGNPALYVQTRYQLYHACADLLAWFGLGADPATPPLDGPGVPATWIGEIATDLDLTDRPDIAADLERTYVHRPHAVQAPHSYTRTTPPRQSTSLSRQE